jgi:hypothetical protein
MLFGGKSNDGFEYMLQTTQSFNEVNYTAALMEDAIRSILIIVAYENSIYIKFFN